VVLLTLKLSNLITMKSIALALAATTLASAPASAGVYINGVNTEFSGKLGGTFNVSQKFGIYGEVSGISNQDEDNNYGSKLGAKFSF